MNEALKTSFVSTLITTSRQSFYYSCCTTTSIVGANYRRRHQNAYPSGVAKLKDGQWGMIPTTQRKATDGIFETADRIGSGLLMINVNAVVQALGDPLYPLFGTTSLPDGGFIGGDALFCNRLREAGMKVYVDHRYPSIGHISEQDLRFPGQGSGSSKTSIR